MVLLSLSSRALASACALATRGSVGRICGDVRCGGGDGGRSSSLNRTVLVAFLVLGLGPGVGKGAVEVEGIGADDVDGCGDGS